MFKNSALLRLHIIIFLWGFTAIIGKLINLSFEHLVFFRMLLASIFLFIYIRFVKKESISISRKLLLQLFGIGSLMGAHWLSFFYAIKISNISIALSCLSLSTLFVAIIEPIIFKRRMDWLEIVMAIIIVTCMSFIFNAEMKYKYGILVGALAAFFGASFQVLNGKIAGKTSSGNIIFYEIFGGWLMVAVFNIFFGSGIHLSELSYQDLILVSLLASVFTAYPMFESVDLMKHISPFTLVLSVNLEPIYGIIMAYFIFGSSEHMSPVFYIASLIMILAIVFNGILKAKKSEKAKETAIIKKNS